MSDIDEYDPKGEVRIHLAEWKSWTKGEGVYVARVRAWDEATGEQREHNRSAFHLPIVTREAERTARALDELKQQSIKQHAALLHYHFQSVAISSVARATRVGFYSVGPLLRHAHENFLYFRAQTSINPTPSLARMAAAAL